VIDLCLRSELKNIRKAYGSHLALKDINLSIPSGAFFTLLGPSGCGKTTLLRAIAGFHQQDAGDILVDGQSIGQLGANQRNVGMVFQDYAVFPHLSVFDNVAFGLVQQKVTSADIRKRVGEILQTVQLEQHAQRMPHQLSGGQQQRVGLARALVIRPKVLLMDEPLSNLDAKLRVDLRRDIRASCSNLLASPPCMSRMIRKRPCRSPIRCASCTTASCNRLVRRGTFTTGQPTDLSPRLLAQTTLFPCIAMQWGAPSCWGKPLICHQMHPQAGVASGNCVAAIRPENLKLSQAVATAMPAVLTALSAKPCSPAVSCNWRSR
jgi:ABC-type nitrate/sulfonate/bicarbonate transport system ATPase subunit